MSDELARVKAERDQLRTDLNKARAAVELTEELFGAGLPLEFVGFARDAVLTQQITTGKDGDVLIDYVPPRAAAEAFMRQRGPELIEATKNTIAAQAKSRSQGAEPARADQVGSIETKRDTMKRAQFDALRPTEQAKLGPKLRSGEMTIVD